MKIFLFRTIAAIAASLVSINLVVGNAVTVFVATIFNGFNAVIKGVATFLMKAVDKNHYEHAKLAAEQYGQLAELDLLIAVTKVKEDALKNKAWTIGHTVAMNRIGSMLYTQHGWEPARIHKYLKSVVESIPGMVYMAGDDPED